MDKVDVEQAEDVLTEKVGTLGGNLNVDVAAVVVYAMNELLVVLGAEAPIDLKSKDFICEFDA